MAKGRPGHVESGGRKISLYLSKDLVRALEARAKKRKMALSPIVREILAMHLERGSK